MKLFLFWPDNLTDIKYVINKLQDSGHEILYVISNLPSSEINLPVDAIYHLHGDAYNGDLPSGVDLYKFDPPSKELIDKMHFAESIVLSMMNKRYDDKYTDERKHIYYNMLRYWSGIIKELKPEAIILSNVPHTVYDYIVYELARVLHIKTFIFNDTWVGDRTILYKDFWGGNENLITNLANNKEAGIKLGDLPADIQEYYLKHQDAKKDSAPPHVSDWKNRHSKTARLKRRLEVVVQSVVDFSIVKRFLVFLTRLGNGNMIKEYKRLQQAPDWQSKFIYAPLNYQPESTTSPQGNIYVDQILQVETVAAGLPTGWILYVKEHPKLWLVRGSYYFSSRYKGYYERLARIPNVRLVPIDTDTFKLIQCAQAVITTTGSPAWEAVLRGKPALLFGYPWYRNCPALFRVSSVADCRLAFNAIQNGWQVNKEEIFRFLYAINKASIPCYIETLPDRKHFLSVEENTKNITKALLDSLGE